MRDRRRLTGALLTAGLAAAAAALLLRRLTHRPMEADDPAVDRAIDEGAVAAAGGGTGQPAWIRVEAPLTEDPGAAAAVLDADAAGEPAPVPSV